MKSFIPTLTKVHCCESIPLVNADTASCAHQEEQVPHAPVDLFGHHDGSSQGSQLSQLRSQKAKQLEKESEAASTEELKGA